MNGNRSVATIDAPEFINVEPYNPLISQCEIKVLYLGKNRNGSYIDKNTAIQMANSLPGCPIVGAYRKDIDDFGDHGHVIRIEDGEISFSCKTVPYGFVAPNAKIWFKKFIDTDDFNNEIEREYLMTQGYLWTGQYEEALSAVQEGKGQSMELDEETLDGKWAEDNNSGMSFFIINDAIFSKLCILGDDVEPCFEGASVTAPDVSKNFTKDPEFAQTLFTMLTELKDALDKEGWSQVDKYELEDINEATEDAIEETEHVADNAEDTATDVDTTSEESADEEAETLIDTDESDDAADDDNAVATLSLEAEATDLGDNDVNDAANDTDSDDISRRLIPRLDMTVEEAADELENLRAEVQSLRDFKLSIENQQKDALINKFYMLSDEDKANIIEHKEEYSLKELEAQLSVLYVQKNVDFNADESNDEDSDNADPILQFSLEDTETSVPAIVGALRKTVHE